MTGPGQDLSLRQRPQPGDHRAEALSLDEIHYQVGIPLLLEEVAYPYQVGVIKARQNLGFLPKLLVKAGEGIGVQPWLWHHLLERDRDVQPGIPGTINSSHTPLSQQSNDPVAVADGLSLL
jgi:hypothetical protein